MGWFVNLGVKSSDHDNSGLVDSIEEIGGECEVTGAGHGPKRAGK